MWFHGHVAVVVDVDLKTGSVYLAEENYDNKKWQEPNKFSRVISLFKVNGYFTLLDITPGKHHNATGAEISGWIYPKT